MLRTCPGLCFVLQNTLFLSLFTTPSSGAPISSQCYRWRNWSRERQSNMLKVRWLVSCKARLEPPVHLTTVHEWQHCPRICWCSGFRLCIYLSDLLGIFLPDLVSPNSCLTTAASCYPDPKKHREVPVPKGWVDKRRDSHFSPQIHCNRLCGRSLCFSALFLRMLEQMKDQVLLAEVIMLQYNEHSDIHCLLLVCWEGQLDLVA